MVAIDRAEWSATVSGIVNRLGEIAVSSDLGKDVG